jgi:hypothetical protein
MRKVILQLLLLLAFAGRAFAIPEICSNGIDDDGSGGDAMCSAPDADRDGYPNSAAYTGPFGTAVDCDDTDPKIYPGAPTTSGCSAGQFRTCQSNGTYTACAATSTYSLKSGSGADYWFSTSGSISSGCGSYSTPCDYRCISNSTLGCYHGRVNGDAWIGKTGTYNTTYSNSVDCIAGSPPCVHQVDLNSLACSSSNHCIIAAEPGASVVIQGTSVSPNEVTPITVSSSSYWDFRDITITGGYSDQGIWFDDCIGYMSRVTAHDIDGKANNNVAGIKCSGSSGRCYIDHSTFYDNYDRTQPLNDNNSCVVFMDQPDFSITDSNCYSTYSTSGAGFGIKQKHGGGVGGTGVIARNIIVKTYNAGIAISGPGVLVYNNYVADANGANSGSSIVVGNLGKNAFYCANQIYNNTIERGPSLEFSNTETYNTFCTGGLLYHDNVVVDNRGTAYGSDGADGFLRACHYCNDAYWTDLATVPVFSNNCYFNSASVPLYFDWFSDNDPPCPPGTKCQGAAYSSLASWQAAGFDVGSYNEDPGLSTNTRAASASHCLAKGWNSGIFTGSPGSGVVGCMRVRGRRGRR